MSARTQKKLLDCQISEEGVAPNTIANWRTGKALPDDIVPILNLFFGQKPKDKRLINWRTELDVLWRRAKGLETIEEDEEPAKPPRDPYILSSYILPPDYCFGRKDDVAQLVRVVLDGIKPVMLLGIGGIGKTTLARKVGSDPKIVKHFGDRCWLLNLATTKTAAEFEAEIGRRLGFDQAQTRFADVADRLEHPQNSFLYIVERLKSLVGVAPGLMLLGNLDTPWNQNDRRAVREVLRELAHINGLVLFATFRGNVAPDVLSWACHPVHRLSLDAAREVFLTYAEVLEGHPLLDKFLTALDGWPLLIRLMALYLRNHRDLQEPLEKWQNEGCAKLNDLDPDEERHASLRACIDFSWQSSRLLTPAKRLFSWLGVSEAGLSPKDRDALLGDVATQAAGELFAFGLAEWREHGRLDLLPPVREVACKFYRPERADMQLWCHHYLQLVSEEAMHIGAEGGKAAMDRLLPEAANIEAAFRAAQNLGADARRASVTAVRAYAKFCCFAGLAPPAVLYELAQACLIQSDERAARGDERAAQDYERAAAHCIRGVADVAAWRVDRPLAWQRFKDAVRLYRRVGDSVGAAHCLVGLGGMAQGWLYQQLAHRHGRAFAGFATPIAACECGGGALCYGAGSLLLCRTMRREQSLIKCIGGFAEKCQEKALELYEQTADEYGEATRGKAACFEARGDLKRLILVAATDGEAGWVDAFGGAMWVSRQIEEARSNYREAQELCRKVKDKHGEANATKRLGDLEDDRSSATVQKFYKRALALSKDAGDALGHAASLQKLGDAVASSKPSDARDLYEEALALLERIPFQDQYSIGRLHYGLARISGHPSELVEAHLMSAREAWTNRPDLLVLLEQLQLPSEDPANAAS